MVTQRSCNQIFGQHPPIGLTGLHYITRYLAGVQAVIKVEVGLMEASTCAHSLSSIHHDRPLILVSLNEAFRLYCEDLDSDEPV